MIPFVEECLQVWRRLGVADPVANEMAADLTVDLQEAEADGGSLEDVLGNSAFDATGFATAWAVERGLVPAPLLAPPGPASLAPGGPGSPLPPPLVPGFWGPSPLSGRRRPPIAVFLTGLVGVLALGFAYLLLGTVHASSVAVAVRRLAGPPAPGRLVMPGPGVFIRPGVFQTRGVIGPNLAPLGLFLLIVGVVSVGLALWYWSPWSGRLRRLRSRGGPSGA